MLGSKVEPVAAMGMVETALALGPEGLFTGWRERLVHVSHGDRHPAGLLR